MLGSSVLDVAMGIVFIYLLLSLICTALNEWISSKINKRGKTLFDGIKNMLNDPEFTGLAQQVYHHGLVDGISQNASDPDKATRLPSYLHSNNFSLALLDILSSRGALASAQPPVNPPAVDKLKAAQDAAKAAAADPTNLALVSKAAATLEQALAAGRTLAASCPDPLANIQAGVNGLPDGHSKESLLVLIDKTRREVTAVEHQAEAFQKNVESWYNEAMDRIGGWYKRWTQKILLGLAFAVVLATNADTIMLAERLTVDGAARASLVNAAQDAAKLPAPVAGTTGSTGASAGPAGTSEDPRIKLVLAKAKDLPLPLGWTSGSKDSKDPSYIPTINDGVGTIFEWLLLKIFGLSVTVFAVSLGAPFWFDMLSKVVNIRGAGAPPGAPKKTGLQGA